MSLKSTRFLATLSRILGPVAATLLVAASSPSAQAQIKRFPVTSQMILSAMQLRQLSIDGAQVHLAAPITASVPNPMLDIQAFTSIDKQNAQIRMVCRNKGECLSFYVSVTWVPQPKPSAKLSSESSAQQNNQPSQTGEATTLPATSSISAPAPLAPVTSIPPASSAAHFQTANYTPAQTLPARPILRSGTPVTLILEEGRIHIRLRVVSQQNGAVGESVRVSTPDRKQAFVAEVVAPNLLKGSF